MTTTDRPSFTAMCRALPVRTGILVAIAGTGAVRDLVGLCRRRLSPATAASTSAA